MNALQAMMRVDHKKLDTTVHVGTGSHLERDEAERSITLLDTALYRVLTGGEY